MIVMSSEVETSLDISVESKTKIQRKRKSLT